jgi:hypothetical protein
MTKKGIEFTVPYISDIMFKTTNITTVTTGRRTTVSPIVACHKLLDPEFFPLLEIVLEYSLKYRPDMYPLTIVENA